MTTKIARRTMLRAGASTLALTAAARLWAQDLPKMRLSAAFTEQDLRADAYKAFGAAMKSAFVLEPFWGNTLFKQGTELVALHLRFHTYSMGWTLLTSAYLFRDAAHLQKTFNSDVGRDFIKMARDKLDIEVIAPVYFGARQVNLKPDRVIRPPADLSGIKLRMPPGEFWQFLGEPIGVNPTPVAFAEVYTALQTGAIDGQDNPLLLSKLMKFDEVTTQFVLTSHVIGFDVMTVSSKAWNALKPDQQQRLRAAAEKAIGDYTVKFEGKEGEVIAALKAEGKKVYTPDVNAFRTFAQKRYVEKYGRDWPSGAMERINAL